jgi:hypothetical protein
VRGVEPAPTTDLGLPRRNGELVFEAPWESRIFGLAVAYVERTGRTWEPFRQRLIAAIAAAPEGTPYYESLTVAFESMLVDDGVLSSQATSALR